jgi:hypothetical protein
MIKKAVIGALTDTEGHIGVRSSNRLFLDDCSGDLGSLVRTLIATVRHSSKADIPRVPIHA